MSKKTNPDFVFLLLGGIFGGIGAIAGALFLVFAVEVSTFLSSAERAEGVIISGARRPVFAFEADGRRHEVEARISSKPPRYRGGETVTVYYPKDDPERARLDDFFELYFGPLMTGIFTLAFGTPGAILFTIAIRGRRRRARAIALGTPVEATVTAIEWKRHIKMNRRSPWVIEAEWEDKPLGVTHHFASDYVWEDPSPYYKAGDKVTVLYVPGEPKTYVFKLDKMPSERETAGP